MYDRKLNCWLIEAGPLSGLQCPPLEWQLEVHHTKEHFH